MIEINTQQIYYALLLLGLSIFSHFIIYRLYRKSFTFKHSMIKILSKHFKPRRNVLRIVALGLKIVFVTSLILVVLAPTLVEEETVTVEVKKELPIEVKKLTKTPVLIILDVSGSMQGYKIEIAKKSAIEFVNSLSPDFNIGFIAFSTTIEEAEPLTANRTKIIEVVKRVRAGGGTQYSPPLNLALSWLSPYHEVNMTSFIVFITDGLPSDITTYRRILPKLREYNITVYTIFIGTEPQGEYETKYMAKTTRGKQYTAKTVYELPKQLQKISHEIKTLTHVKIQLKIEKKIKTYKPLYEHFIPMTLISLIILWLINVKNYKLVY